MSRVQSTDKKSLYILMVYPIFFVTNIKPDLDEPVKADPRVSFLGFKWENS